MPVVLKGQRKGRNFVSNPCPSPHTHPLTMSVDIFHCTNWERGRQLLSSLGMLLDILQYTEQFCMSKMFSGKKMSMVLRLRNPGIEGMTSTWSVYQVISCFKYFPILGLTPQSSVSSTKTQWELLITLNLLNPS